MLSNEEKKELKKASNAYKSKDYETAEEIYSSLHMEHAKEFSIWDNRFYAWTLYNLHVKNPISEDDLLESGSLITELVDQSNTSKQDGPCAYTLTVLKIMETLEDWEEVKDWSEKLDPELLSKNRFEYVDNSGNKRFAQSKKEKWYNLTSKALMNIKDSDDAIELCEEALENLNEFTNDSDVWFKWRIAKSLNEIGDYDEALEYLDEVKQFKNDWFISAEIANNYFEMGELDDSLKYAVNGVLSDGEIDKKVKLYELIGKILDKQGDIEKADKHAYLSYAIRQQNEWNIEDDLENRVKNAGFNLENINYIDIEQQLHEYWENYN